MAELSGVELARVFAEAAKALAGQESLGTTAAELVALAVAVVPGVEAAGVSLARNGHVETVAATDELVNSCDAAQYSTGQGPCLDAVWDDRIVQVDDLASDGRWPEFAKLAVDLGAASMLACHLSSERGTLSALNMYARTPNAFGDQSRRLAMIFATHATIALEFARLETDLRAAVETRQGIGQAVGIVMERHRLPARQAFDLLVRSSQRLNVKLRDLADAVVNTGLDPKDTALLARLAANEAGSRANELHEQLSTADGRPRGSTAEQLATATRRATAASSRATSSLRRAIDAKLSSAAAHDRAAEEHERQARHHRKAAEKARAAAKVEQASLGEAT
jgi:GAF domain-containing protein